MPTKLQRQAAHKRAEARLKAGGVVAQDGVVDEDVMLDLAVAFDVAPRDVFATWLKTDRREAMDRLFAAVGTAGTNTSPTPVSAASGVPVAAGTGATATATTTRATVPTSIASPPGLRVGARSGARIGGEAGSPRDLAAAMAALGTTSAPHPVQASAAQAPASRDRFHRPSVSGNASGAGWQRARELADAARVRAAQIARFGH